MKISLFLLAALATFAADWSQPVQIIVDETIAATYKARYDGADSLEIVVTLAPGWHTFAMDNQIRADEALKGKKAIGMDKPTSFVITGGLAAEGSWMQSALMSFSKPELRIFSWGFEKEARFLGKVKKTSGPTASVAVKAQACTEAICKNIDTALTVPLTGPATPASTAGLEPVRTK